MGAAGRSGIVVAGSCALVMSGAGAHAAQHGAVSGELARLSAGQTHTPELSGHVKVVRTGSGSTRLMVHVKGLAPGETYGVHLHNAPCSAANPGGGHYKHDPAGVTTPPNELWASSDPKVATAGITANAAGNAHGTGVADWTARGEAQAVVIHAGSKHGGTTAGGLKLACADLR